MALVSKFKLSNGYFGNFGVSYLLLLFFFVGYLFSADIMATMERHSRDVAAAIVEKAKKLCKDLNNVSY